MRGAPVASTRGPWVLLAAAAIGAGLSGWLTYLHVRLHYDPTYVSVCAFGERLNCETVAASSYSVVLGAPLSVWGLLGYLVLGLLAHRALRGRTTPSGVDGLLALYSITLGLLAIALLVLSSFVIGAVCLLCTGTYLVNWLTMIVAVRRARQRGGIVQCVLADLAAVRARPTAVALPAGVALIGALLIQLALPHYWDIASWRGASWGNQGVDDDGHPWIGAAAPEIIVHEYLDYECPHCRTTHRKLRRVLLPHADRVRLVRHDYARMPCVPNDAARRRSSCAMARAGVCAADAGRFWEWSDAVLAHPRPLTGDGRESYMLEMAEQLGFDPERFDECMYSAATVDRAQAVFKDARKRHIKDTPTYVVGDQRLDAAELLELLSARL